MITLSPESDAATPVNRHPAFVQAKPAFSKTKDPRKREPLVSSEKPVLTSAHTGWIGLIAELFHLNPPIAFHERTAQAHLIELHFRPATLEWFLDGEQQLERTMQGNIDVIACGTRFAAYAQEELDFLVLELDASLVEATAREFGTIPPIQLTSKLGIRDPQIEHIGLALKVELETGCASGRTYGDALALALSAQLLARYAIRLPASQRTAAVLLPFKLRRVIDYVNANLATDLRLSEIADVAEMNPYHFCRAFRSSTGMPPHQYVINRRIAEAKRLLANRDLSLVEVALSVGFKNQSHFSTVFRKLTCSTPKVYRNRLP